ncbi:MAG: SPOR domain-containing protein [Desulfobacterales bacterium]|nr:SPOR domain-containing protein [Desulfobacterales bacterium]
MKKSEKTSEKKKSSKETGRKGTMTWICMIFFVSAWMFVLGIFVGRGTAPIKFDVENLQKELAALKEAVVKEGREKFKTDRDTANAKMELGFYEALKETGSGVRHEVKRPVPQKTVAPQKNAKTMTAQKVEKSASSSKQTKAEADAGFTIQVASLKDMKVAVELAEMLKKKGYQAYMVSVKIPDKGDWHRIRIGHFKNRPDAADTLEKLKKDKYRPIIIKE